MSEPICYQISSTDFNKILELLTDSSLAFGVLGLLVGFVLALLLFYKKR
ncbi:hypothetical protein ACTQ9E_000078 [Vibrio vulnificus]|nr:hypothetical protein [Vibrio vulnificus]